MRVTKINLLTTSLGGISSPVFFSFSTELEFEALGQFEKH